MSPPPGTFIWVLQGKLGITAQGARLWGQCLATAQGSVNLSFREAEILRRVILAPHTSTTDLIELLWSREDGGPEFAANGVRQMVSHLNRKIRFLGLHCVCGQGLSQLGYKFQRIIQKETPNVYKA